MFFQTRPTVRRVAARVTRIGWAAGGILSLTTPLADSAEAAGKAGYTLWRPTPRDEMRELSTDRPDQTESPYTVDAGHLQLEFDFLNYTVTRETEDGADLRIRELSVAPFNLKIGLTHDIDLQLMVDPYVRTRVSNRLTDARVTRSGFGDVTTRLKWNLWGNDAGTTALAVMPFVKWPLSASDIRNGETEGGIIVPLGVALPGGWAMGLMTEIDFVADGTGGHDTEWLNSLTFGRDLTDKIGAYIEFVSVHGGAEDFEWLAQLDVGFTYAISPDIQLDGGCNFGLTDAAPDYQPFLGLTIRR